MNRVNILCFSLSYFISDVTFQYISESAYLNNVCKTWIFFAIFMVIITPKNSCAGVNNVTYAIAV